ncbi:hypothetical protein FOZ63_026353 [Perkinsus olseni]|uniref:RING-type domain-containing protein n=1 Tax=Perkinsus olseni TaxID=32597 RepID=A0A7J6UN15_PEROL|nr:hypothetical protein FOZ63_026353 [Perkinsus olseni]
MLYTPSIRATVGRRQLHYGAVPIASWILVGVLAFVLALSLVICLVFAKRMPSDVGTHICRCGGCGRRFRVPSTIPADTFMCRNCIREGRRRQSIVLEEEREERLNDMNSAPKRVRSTLRLAALVPRFLRLSIPATGQPLFYVCLDWVQVMTLHRVSSHFYRMKTRVFGSSPNDDDIEEDIESGSQGLDEDAQRPTINIHRGFTKAVDAGQVQIPEDNLCEICFDDEARVVLLPCGHGGLCEGCAKDIISSTGNCYLCRQPVKLVAIVGRQEPSKRRTTSAVSASRVDREASDMSSDNYFAQVVGPDQLHHLESRAVDRQGSGSTPQQHVDSSQLGTPAVTQSQGLPSIAEGSAAGAPRPVAETAGEGTTSGDADEPSVPQPRQPMESS